jgi:hypothetical protein
MWSWLRQKGWRRVISRQLGLLLLVLLVAAKPEDVWGSRYGEEGSTIPNDDWWQYKCTMDGCEQFAQYQEMPTLKCVCPIHANVIMKCIHNPETD